MRFLSVLLLASVVGCASSAPVSHTHSSEVELALPVHSEVEPAMTGSIFNDNAKSRAFGFQKNFLVGDILTVVLSESAQAQRSSGINLTKEVSNTPLDQVATAFPDPVDNGLRRVLKALTFAEQSRSDKGIGTSDQAASLSGAIAVVVTRIFPNGNLVVEGKKRLSLSEGEEEIYVSGVITPKDVQPDNTVLSSRIAQANIAYRGKGDIANVGTANWGSKLFNQYWPF